MIKMKIMTKKLIKKKKIIKRPKITYKVKKTQQKKMKNLRLFIQAMFMQEHQHQRVLHLLRVLLFTLISMIRKKVLKVKIQKFKMRIQKNPKKNNDDDEPQEIVEKVEQPIDVENVEVSEHCNQQNSEEKKPLDEELLNE